jgi:hypothetical protein
MTSSWSDAEMGTAKDRAVSFWANKYLLEQATTAVLAALLKRIRGWDVMDATADGPYWRAEIDAALASLPPVEPPHGD